MEKTREVETGFMAFYLRVRKLFCHALVGFTKEI